MTDVIIFKLKEEPGFIDGSEFNDDEMYDVPEDTVCLSLENANVTDIGVSRLPKLNSLRCIDLDSTSITDASMDRISTFKSLEEVWIEDTKITDVGFKKLVLLPKLRYVSFLNTEISDEAFNYVIERVPNLKYEG